MFIHCFKCAILRLQKKTKIQGAKSAKNGQTGKKNDFKQNPRLIYCLLKPGFKMNAQISQQKFKIQKFKFKNINIYRNLGFRV